MVTEQARAKKTEYMRAYRQAHKDEINANRRAHYASHPEERHKAIKRACENQTPEYRAKYYLAHREYLREKGNAWMRANAGKMRIVMQRRRARRAQLESSLTASQWNETLNLFDHRCAYCGNRCDDLEQEHVVPVVRGGGYTIDNIVPSCRKCNAGKHDDTLLFYLLRKSQAP